MRLGLMLRNWRLIVLVVLFVGPVLAYVGLGALWLNEHRGPLGIRGELLYYSMTVWVVSGLVFAVLAKRWTGATRLVLPPLDWNAPESFTPRDREAWDMVQRVAERGENLEPGDFVRIDTYIDVGRELARRLATHYYPHHSLPFENVPVVELLAALQLAAEDLDSLCRSLPGGDMITPGHWKKAVAAVGWVQRANELYTYLLPVFQPVAGLARLGAQKLMVQPAWRDAQTNLMRWFFSAYVNRLGAHLVELLSGRLVIGVSAYRRLRLGSGPDSAHLSETIPLRIGIAGMSGSGKSAILSAVRAARQFNIERAFAELLSKGQDLGLLERLRTAELVELSVPREVSGTSSAIARALEVDVLVYVRNATADDLNPARTFLEAWREQALAKTHAEPPPVVVVVTGADTLGVDEPWGPPYDWLHGRRSRELAMRALLERSKAELPGFVVATVVAGAPAGQQPYGVAENLLPILAGLLPQAERSALLRRSRQLAAQSVPRRVFGQASRLGKKLWTGVGRARRRGPGKSPR